MENLPAINAFLNSCATFCLITGYLKIKAGHEKQHKMYMVSALFFSAIFLSCYLVYHYNFGSKGFPDLGWIKTVYLIILVPHIIFAALMVPMIVMTFFFAFTDKREKHKKWAKITLPIWLYVSFTGVVIYLMLYHLAPALNA
jgi:uncharacterized membrane protein YozB (DUF420 family)